MEEGVDVNSTSDVDMTGLEERDIFRVEEVVVVVVGVDCIIEEEGRGEDGDIVDWVNRLSCVGMIKLKFDVTGEGRAVKIRNTSSNIWNTVNIWKTLFAKSIGTYM